MTSRAEALIAEIDALPPDQRLAIVEHVLAVVELDEPAWSAAWLSEVERRRADGLSGASPLAEFEQRLRARWSAR